MPRPRHPAPVAALLLLLLLACCSLAPPCCHAGMLQALLEQGLDLDAYHTDQGLASSWVRPNSINLPEPQDFPDANLTSSSTSSTSTSTSSTSTSTSPSADAAAAAAAAAAAGGQGASARLVRPLQTAGAQAQGAELGAQRQPVRDPGGGRVVSAGTAAVNVNLEIGPFTGVVWRGWGTSLAWFANFVGGLPQNEVDEILDGLFSKKKGLGLNIVRYIIPGGFNPKISHNLTSRPFQAGGWGFRPWPNEKYNWTADPNQRKVLIGAVKRGVDIAEAVAYSPPWWMTVSQDSSGNVGGTENLEPKNYFEFVKYITDIVLYFKKLYGVTFDALDPFNEPLASWWKKGGGQEGCGFKLASAITVLQLTRRALTRRGLNNVKLVGLDDWAGPTFNAIQKYPKELDSLLSRFAVHGYRIPTYVYRPSKEDFTDWTSLKTAVWNMSKEVWDVEWGPWTTIPRFPSDMDVAFIQARTMAEQINIFGIAAFVHWQAVAPSTDYLIEWPIPKALGMIRLQYDYQAPFKPIYTKQYYAQMHYSRWIIPGSRIVNVVGVYRFVVAAFDPKNKNMVFVFTNQRSSFTTFKFTRLRNLRVRSPTVAPMKMYVYRTTQAENYRLVYIGDTAQMLEKVAPIKVVPNSITTVIFKNVVVKG